MVVITQYVQDLMLRSEKIVTDAKNLRKRIIELIGGAQKRTARATVDFARLNGVADELAIFKSKFATSPVERPNSRWSACSIA